MPGKERSYRRKIKTREELKTIIGSRPRTRSVIMCHGTFDLVHPGHIRHLLYANDKADILVVSLTCDAYISKGEFRPFVPQELRAMNLAVLEVVDFVIIDDQPPPLENVKYLQPDYFAKGYEYIDGGLNPKTREELDTLNSYGGELILTPGDVVYSSSAIIDNAPPDLSIEKLSLLMDSEDVSFSDLKETVDAFGKATVHILGDTIVDSYIYCSMIGSAATKTPTVSLKYERQIDFIGGAAVVAKHMRQTGRA